MARRRRAVGRRRSRRRHGEAHACPRRSRASCDGDRAARRDARRARGSRAGRPRAGGECGSDSAPGHVRGRRRVGAGVPLVRSRRVTSRDRARASTPRPHLAGLELARRRRPLDGAAQRDHRERDDRGVGRRTRPRRERAASGPVETARFSFEQALDRDGLLDLVLSRSYCAKLPAAEREPVLDAVGHLYDETSGGDAVRLAYVTECFRAGRRPVESARTLRPRRGRLQGSSR